MQKVKIFHEAADPKGFQFLEDQVNVWLSEHDNVEIIYRQVSTAAGAISRNLSPLPIIHCTIAIFYRNV